MDTINSRKITLDADLLLDAEMQILEGGVASESVLQTTVRILQYKPHGVVVVHATKLKVAKHTLNYNICHCIEFRFWCSDTKT